MLNLELKINLPEGLEQTINYYYATLENVCR